MEKKTNLSEEFGHNSNLAATEFGMGFANSTPKTKLSSELNRSRSSDSLEFSGAYTNKEFSSVSNDPVSTPKSSRQETHRHSLLMQMASVGLSIVLVTNSFGLDILGDDSLFAKSAIDYIVIGEVIDETMYDEDPALETIDYVIQSSNRASENPGPYKDTVRYDEASNTLYLDSCQVDVLWIKEMEEDLTIFVENTSYIGVILNTGVNITISGNQHTSLIINQHSEDLWWYGVAMYGEGRDTALTISPGITVKVRGIEGAIAVDNTTANPAIRFDPTYTAVSGSLRSGSFPFTDGSFVEGGAPDWTISNNTDTIANYVIFAPIGEDISIPDEMMYAHIP